MSEIEMDKKKPQHIGTYNVEVDVMEEDKVEFTPSIFRDNPWLSPKRMLVLFTYCAFFTYYDRGGFSAILPILESNDDEPKKYSAFRFSNLQGGILAGSFMVGYCVASPLFAHLSNTKRPFRLMFIGLSIWTFAVMLTAAALDFWTMLLGRLLSGVGEASFLCLAPPFIDTFSPKESKSVWLAIFYAAIPLGYGGGIMVSGSWAGSAVNLMGDSWAWRSTFLFEAVAMLPVLVLLTIMKGPRDMKQVEEEKDILDPASKVPKIPLGPFTQEIIGLLKCKTWLYVSLGYAMQTFVVGAFALLSVKYLKVVYGYSETTASLSFGGVAIGTAFIGTAVGGIILQKLKARLPEYKQNETNFCEQGAKMLFYCSIPGLPLALVAFLMEAPLFFMFVALCEVTLFSMTGPINSVVMWAVPFHKRALALGVTVIFVHSLGDAISPTIIGAIVGYDTPDHWRRGMFIGSLMLLPSILFFFLSWRSASDVVKDFEGKRITQPLLDLEQNPHGKEVL